MSKKKEKKNRSEMKEVYGVIGDPVEHSLSPVMHNAAFEALNMDAIYLAFRVPPEYTRDAIRGAWSLGFSGLNVTIPLKEIALSYVSADEIARKIGAINTISFKKGVPYGYNTDGIAALKVLEEAVGDIRGKHVLILGAGGAAKAIAFYLASAGAFVKIANRTAERAAEIASKLNASWTDLENLKEHIKDAEILINATSVGMYPYVENTLVTAEMMHHDLIVFDIVYNPVETRLLREAKKANVKMTIDGVKMLVYQGAAAFEIWTGVEPPKDVMERAVRNALSDL